MAECFLRHHSCLGHTHEERGLCQPPAHPADEASPPRSQNCRSYHYLEGDLLEGTAAAGRRYPAIDPSMAQRSVTASANAQTLFLRDAPSGQARKTSNLEAGSIAPTFTRVLTRTKSRKSSKFYCPQRIIRRVRQAVPSLPCAPLCTCRTVRRDGRRLLARRPRGLTCPRRRARRAA